MVRKHHTEISASIVAESFLKNAPHAGKTKVSHIDAGQINAMETIFIKCKEGKAHNSPKGYVPFFMNTRLDFPVPLQDFWYPLWRDIEVDGLLISWYGLWLRNETLSNLGVPRDVPVKIDSGVYSAVKHGAKLPKQKEYVEDVLARCEGYDVSVIQQDVVDNSEKNIKNAEEFIELSEKHGFRPITVVQGSSIPDYINAFHTMKSRGLLTGCYAIGGLLFAAKYLPYSHISYLLKYFQTYSDKNLHVLGYYKGKFAPASLDSNVPIIYAEKGYRWDGPYKQVKVADEFSPDILAENYKNLRDYIQNKEDPVQMPPREVEEFNGTLKEFQQEVMDSLDRDVVVDATTGTGKTFLSTSILPRKGRTVVLEPYKAIVSEFAGELADSDLSVAVRYEGKNNIPEDFNLLLTTYASFRVMLEQPQAFPLETVDYVVIDEIHLLESQPLETLVNIIKSLSPCTKVILMSGTLVPEQFKKWLGNPAVISHKKERNIAREVVMTMNPIDYAVEYYTSMEKPVLIVAATKKNAERIANKIYHPRLETVEGLDTSGLNKKEDSYHIELAQKGIGLHHGGLEDRVRKFVEYHYREGYLNVIVATTTLSAGVNLPAKNVVMEGKQYKNNKFKADINNILQVEGRLRSGGRNAILLKGNDPVFGEKEDLTEIKRYVETTFEPRNIAGKKENDFLAFLDALHGASLYCSDAQLKKYTRKGLPSQTEIDPVNLLDRAGLLKKDEEAGKFKLTRIGRLGAKLGLEMHQFIVVNKLIEITKRHPEMGGIRLWPGDYYIFLAYALSTRPHIEKKMYQYNIKARDKDFFERILGPPYYKYLKIGKCLQQWAQGYKRHEILKKTGLYSYELRILTEDAIRVLQNLVVLLKMADKTLLKNKFEKLLEDIETGLPKDWRKLLTVDGIGREISIRIAEKAEELEKAVDELTNEELESVEGVGKERVNRIAEYLAK